MNDSKPWYQSKGVWTGVVTALVGVYGIVGQNLGPAFHFTLPSIPDFIFTILGAMGVYSRVTAEKQIQ